MRYLIQNPLITEGTTKTGRYAGQKYLFMQVDLYNDIDESLNPNQLPRYFTLQETFIRHYMENGAATPNPQLSVNGVIVYNVDMTKVDEKWHHIDKVVPCTKFLPRPYGRVDESGSFIRAANGSVTPVMTITVQGRRIFDPDMVGMPITDAKGAITTSDGWRWLEDMDRVFNRLLERNYKPLDDSPLAPPAAAPTQSIEEAAASRQERIAAMQAQLNNPTQPNLVGTGVVAQQAAPQAQTVPPVVPGTQPPF